MKKLGISLDGVIRDYISQFDKHYRRIYIFNPSIVKMDENFKLKEPTEFELQAEAKNIEKSTKDKISLPVDTDDLLNHYHFDEQEETFEDYDKKITKKTISPQEALESFMYEKYPFQIFGDAEQFPEAMHYFNKIQGYGLRNEMFETILLSNLKGSAIPANYFFMHKSGSRARNFKIVESTEEMWNLCDAIVDVKQETFHYKPEGKVSIKIDRPYNQYANADYTLKSLKDLFNEILLKKIFENK